MNTFSGSEKGFWSFSITSFHSNSPVSRGSWMNSLFSVWTFCHNSSHALSYHGISFLFHSFYSVQFSSVHFSHSVMSYSLWPHEPQHVKPPCPSPTPGVHPNPCPLCQWCHPTISSSVVPFSSCPQSFPASGSFPVSQLFTSGGISIRISASASVLPMNIQDWSLGWTGWNSLQIKGLSRVFSNSTVLMFNSSVLSFLYSPTLLSYTHLFWCGVLYVLSTLLLDL